MNFLREMLDGEVKTWENVILKLKSIGYLIIYIIIYLIIYIINLYDNKFIY